MRRCHSSYVGTSAGAAEGCSENVNPGRDGTTTSCPRSASRCARGIISAKVLVSSILLDGLGTGRASTRPRRGGWVRTAPSLWSVRMRRRQKDKPLTWLPRRQAPRLVSSRAGWLVIGRRDGAYGHRTALDA